MTGRRTARLLPRAAQHFLPRTAQHFLARTAQQFVARATTRRVALSPAELVTTAVAFRVSGAANSRYGHPYLARGVVGDLLGFAVLAALGRAAGARLRHEALVCLAAIGAVLLLDPRWPLAVSDTALWLLVGAGLVAYLAARRRWLTDPAPAGGTATTAG